MGIFKGVILIVGGGYYGKLIFFKVIEWGVYNYVFGDGCEFVVIDLVVIKIRVEDGCSVVGVDIFFFIN